MAESGFYSVQTNDGTPRPEILCKIAQFWNELPGGRRVFDENPLKNRGPVSETRYFFKKIGMLRRLC